MRTGEARARARGVSGPGRDAGLHARDGSAGLREAVLEAARGKPFLGICIGLQMLFEASEEGDTPGLGLLPGRVRRFPAEKMVDDAGRRG